MKIDTKKQDALKALMLLGFVLVHEKEHIKMRNAEGKTISLPNHKRIKGSTISRTLRDVGIDKKEFFALV